MKVAILASVLVTSAFTSFCAFAGKKGTKEKTARVHIVLEQIETDGLVVEYN